jgi:protoporphyrinogen oxidase
MQEPRRFRNLILGAGPTGLGAAYRLAELGEADFHVLERSGHVGGLASSFIDEKGFTWDVGGHVQFSHYEYFDAVMEDVFGGSNGWLEHRRDAWAWMEDRFVPYPVQNHLSALTDRTRDRCIQDILALGEPGSGTHPPAHFGEWILRNFGRGLADAFLLPYNRKVWAYPAEMLAYGWIGDRVARPDRATLLGQSGAPSWGPNRLFRFPKQGGTGAIWNAVADRIGRDRISLEAEVTEIDSARRQVTTSKGERFEYERLLTSLPLDLLCGLLRPSLAPSLREAATRLLHSSSNIVGLGLRGQAPDSLRGKTWIYFPEQDCPFYRVTVFSGYSPENVPDPGAYWSLMTETSESAMKPLDPSRLVEETIRGALAKRLISSRDEIVSVWRYRAEHGYPTPSLERDEALALLLPALEERGISSRGRFGAWKYEVSNQDHSMMQGVEWAERVILGKPELTVFHPDEANRSKEEKATARRAAGPARPTGH